MHTFRPLRCGLFLAAALVFAFIAGQSFAQQDIIVLRDGTQISADRVTVQPDNTLRLYRRRAVNIARDKKDENWHIGRGLELFRTVRWDELSDASLQRFFPTIWFAKQKPGGAPPGNPVGTPAVPPPGSPGAPLPAIEIPRFAGIKDAGGNVFLASLSLARMGDGYFFEGQLTNASGRKFYDVRAILHSADLMMMETVDVAPTLEPANKGVATFRVPLAAMFDPQKTDVLLEIKCFDANAAEENRRAAYYTFKIQRLSTGQYAAVPAN